MTQFVYNEFGICKNPYVVFETKGEGYSLIIHTAMNKHGEWVYAYNVNCAGEGYGYGVRLNDLNTFSTRRAALTGALLGARRYLHDKITRYRGDIGRSFPSDELGLMKPETKIELARKLIAIIEEELRPKIIQPSLFGPEEAD